MKVNHYIIEFVGHHQQDVYAVSSEMAIILAQAEQIKAGLNPNVISVKKNGRTV